MIICFEGNLTLSAVRGEDGFYIVREPLIWSYKSGPERQRERLEKLKKLKLEGDI